MTLITCKTSNSIRMRYFSVCVFRLVLMSLLPFINTRANEYMHLSTRAKLKTNKPTNEQNTYSKRKKHWNIITIAIIADFNACTRWIMRLLKKNVFRHFYNKKILFFSYVVAFWMGDDFKVETCPIQLPFRAIIIVAKCIAFEFILEQNKQCIL